MSQHTGHAASCLTLRPADEGAWPAIVLRAREHSRFTPGPDPLGIAAAEGSNQAACDLIEIGLKRDACDPNDVRTARRRDLVDDVFQRCVFEQTKFECPIHQVELQFLNNVERSGKHRTLGVEIDAVLRIEADETTVKFCSRVPSSRSVGSIAPEIDCVVRDEGEVLRQNFLHQVVIECSLPAPIAYARRFDVAACHGQCAQARGQALVNQELACH